jgi:uncharacterized damage-inducible protein DinB
MTLQELRLLLDYHYWARDRLLSAVDALTREQFLQDNRGSFRSVRDTLAHLLSVERAWYARWQGESPAVLTAGDAFSSCAAIRDAWKQHESKMRAFLEELGPEGVKRVFEYKTLAGTPSSSPFWQMLQHIVNHASYHRGQVTTMLRQLGAASVGQDIITFYRERG